MQRRLRIKRKLAVGEDAISLERQVLRDIRSRRTKLVAPNIEDLALLEQRGLITMDDGELVLTDAANSVIDPELAL